MGAEVVQIRRKGIITIPVELRRKYDLSEGDVYTLLDLGDGAFLLTPKISQLTKAGDQIAQMMAEENVTLDDLMEALDEERERYYREHYAEN